MTDRIVPVIDRRAPWLPGTQPLRDHLRTRGRITITLHATADRLTAHVDDEPISDLPIDPDDFFSRTQRRVLAIGGTVTAQAVGQAGSLEVWIEDDRPLRAWSPGTPSSRPP